MSSIKEEEEEEESEFTSKISSRMDTLKSKPIPIAEPTN